MFMKQDWFMRQIEIVTAAIARLVFGRGEVSTVEQAVRRDVPGEPAEEQPMALLRMGKLAQAEDLLFSRMDKSEPMGLALAVEFYRQANELSDEALAEQGFAREELLDGLHEAMAYYHVVIPGL